MALGLRNLADVLDWCHHNGRNQTSESRVTEECKQATFLSSIMDITLFGIEAQCNLRLKRLSALDHRAQ